MGKNTYYASPYLSQSKLKRLIGKDYDNPSEVGNLVDAMCTDPDDLVNYLVSKSGITPALKELWKDIIYTCGELTDECLQSLVITYGKGKYTKERIKSDLLKYEDFAEELKTGKVCVTREEWDQAEKMSNIVLNHPRTQFLKDANKQVAVFNENFYGHKVKGLLDYQMPDKNKQVIDLKSVYSMSAYMKNFWKFRYDLQTTWYSDISGARVCPRIVFVAPDADYPIVLELEPHTCLVARSGGYIIKQTILVNGKKYPVRKYRYGYLDLLKRYNELTNMDYTYPPNDFESIVYGVKKV